MKPAKYIASDRRGEKAHQIEIEAMVNPFLAEALDGYEAVDGDHRANIERLEAQIEECARRNSTRKWLAILSVAIIVILVAVAAFFYIDRSELSVDYATVVETTEPTPPDAPVIPDTTVVALVDSAALVVVTPRRRKEVVDTLAVVAQRNRVVEAPVKDLETNQSVDNNENLVAAAPKVDSEAAVVVQAKPQDSTAKKNINKQLSNNEGSTPQNQPDSLPSALLETTATFRGGDIDSFRIWVEGRVKAPNMALASTLSKPIVISFVVNDSGRITDVDVLQNPDNELTEQVVKAVKRSPRWEPARHEGRKVASKFSLITRPERWPNK